VATTKTTTTRKSSRGIGARLTAKVGPLPVWGWALLLLIAGYLVYRFSGAGSSSSSSSSGATNSDGSNLGTDAGVSDSSTTPAGGDTGGSPPASGQGGAADNLSSDLFGQLTGLQGSVDALTALVQSTNPFPDPGSAGAGASVPLDGSTGGGGDDLQPYPGSTATTTTTTPAPPPPPPAKPSATPPAPAKIRYWTYAPGKAPKNRKGDEAPAKGPAGTTLHFAKGKGYYYA